MGPASEQRAPKRVMENPRADRYDPRYGVLDLYASPSSHVKSVGRETSTVVSES